VTPRVVFDTNVLFSAIGWGGTPGQCVKFAQQGQVRGITCVEILDELCDRLIAKLQFDDTQAERVVASLLLFLEVLPITGTMTGLQPDPKDDKILECAIVGSATHIVTGDKRHLLPLRHFRGADVVSPAELVEFIQRIPNA
jgi:uncharacterized protein